MPAQQSRTHTQVASQAPAVLHLRPVADSLEANTNHISERESRPRVRWSNDVVDNEHMDKKKSKICCIFHPQREFGESSGESSSDSSDSDSSDASEGEESAEGVNGEVSGSSGDVSDSKHDECCGHHHHKSRKGRKSRSSTKTKTKRAASPNAYERQPQYKNKSVLPQDTI